MAKYQVKLDSAQMTEKGRVEFGMKGGGIEYRVKRGSRPLGKIRLEGSKVRLSGESGNGLGVKVNNRVWGGVL